MENETKLMTVRPDYSSVEVGKRIHDIRIREGVRAIEMANDFWMPTSKLYKIEEGKQDIKGSDLYNIAKYLNVSSDYLLYGESCMDELDRLTINLSPEQRNNLAASIKIMMGILQNVTVE